ncbi:segregation/condensation protein ScpB [Lentibacillus halophilus]|uniref:Segregation and condensation protein B n=1 Tax=Lentibacillus halophilus TaxID=295065 RepID=A0ABP3J6T3_9BACI
MKMSELKAITEGLLFAGGDEGVTCKQLAAVLDMTIEQTGHVLEELQSDYEHTNRGILLMQSHHVYYLTTKPEHSSYVKKLLQTSSSSKLSQAALETLAIIAYLQPITRTEIEEIRGVKSDRPVQTLITRSLVEESGRKEEAGRPILFVTTKDFLTYFGLVSLEELPPLPETINEQEIEQEADLYFSNGHEPAGE